MYANKRPKEEELVQDLIREIDAETYDGLKKFAKKKRLTMESLVWILSDSFPGGYLRCQLHSEVPKYVKKDGLVVEYYSDISDFVRWEFTRKAKDILLPFNKI